MSTGQLAGGVAGGIAGALLIGSGVGIAGGVIIGGLLAGLSSAQKTVIEIGKKSDRTFQGSEYGGDIPRVYGTVALSGSQIVWMENNQLKEVVKKKKSGGKGGASTVTKTYSYYATFALMLCQGEIAGIRRIWCSDKLIYNAGSDDLETIIASNQAAKGWRLYRGTDDQLPDPRYEADVGVGNAPAFRGYTYIVFDDFALADYSNTLQAAQFKVEVVERASFTGARMLFQDQIKPVGTHSWSRFPGDGTYPPSSGESPEYLVEASDLLISASDGSMERVWTTTANLSRPWQRPLRTVSSFDIGFGPQTLYPFDDWFIGYADGDPVFYQYQGSSSPYFFIITCGGNLVYSSATYFTGGDFVWGIGPDRDAGEIYLWMQSPSGRTYKRACSSGDEENIAFNFGTLPALARSYSIPYMQGSTSGAIAEENGYIWFYDNALNQVNVCVNDGGALIIVETISGFDDGSNHISCFASSGVFYAIARDKLFVFTRNPKINQVRPSLADVVVDEATRSDLIIQSDLDISLFTQEVTGYRITGGSIRSVIEPLQGAYPFDVVPAGYKIKFVPRGQSSAMTIPWEDLAATDGSDIGDSLPYSREMDSQLPQKVSITALSADREYGESTQYYERLNTSAVNAEDRDIPLVLSDDEIAQMAEKLLFLRWLERDDFDFSLPPTYLGLEPADVATVNAKFGTFELRLTEINYESDGRLTCKAKINNAAIYTSNAVGAPGPGPDGTIGVAGQSLWLPLDIPVIDETLQNAPGMATAATGYANGWPGAVLVRSNDSGQTWSDIQAYTGECSIGYARGTLPANSCALIDQRSLQIDMLSGNLESITEAQMITGQNYAAYGLDGRWEIVRFQIAALQADGSYVLSRFIRGDKGTEWATGLHQAGDTFILLDDPDNTFIGLPIESLGLQRLYRAVTSGASIDSAVDQPFTYRGVNLKPLSPTYPVGSRNSSGDLAATWTRRSRLSSSWWITGVAAPVGESSEAYDVEVMSGTMVKRTISTTSPAITYTAAQQTADFGSAQASITLRIYQISSAVGRGYPLEVTL